MIRSNDPKIFEEGFRRCPDWQDREDTDFAAWCANPENIMLVDGEDIGLLAAYIPGVKTGHWFFKSRGKEALEVAKRMLKVGFDEYGIQVVRGLTPIELRHACILARKLGFKSYGLMEYEDGEECELFCLTKQEFEAINGNT